MNALDFISDSPKTYIFKKTSNKTNLGGLLTFLYLILLALIIFIYLYDFFKNYYHKFEITYFYNQIRNETKEMKKMDPEFNPTVNFSFKVLNEEGELVPEKDFFVLLYDGNMKNVRLIKSEETFSRKVDEFYMMLIYNCPDHNCTFEKNLTKLLWDEYSFILSYNSKIMEHENIDSPVEDIQLNYTYNFFLDDNLYYISPIWEFFNYEEKKGVFSRMIDSLNNKPNIHTFGQIKNIKSLEISNNIDDTEDIEDIICDKGECGKIILMLHIDNPFEGIHYYKRSSISFWDYLANIAALGTTIFNWLCKAFGLLYSRNFDNYKIIENIFSKESKKVRDFSSIDR